MRTALHALIFLAFLGLWTWKLLESHPVPEGVGVGVELSRELRFALAKSLHFGAYAFLAVLGGSIARCTRTPAFALLALHAVGTEIGQTFVPHRSGTVLDVFIDWCGLAAGAVVLCRFTSPPSAPGTPPGTALRTDPESPP